MESNETIYLCPPIYPHGIILYYNIVAINNETSAMSGSVNISTLNASVYMLCTEPGVYLVKVLLLHACINVYSIV